MVTTSYDPGDTKRLNATFKDIAGVLTDPTTTTFTLVEPDGVVVTHNVVGPDLINPSVGVFYVDFPITKEGNHSWSIAGTGLVAQKNEGEFYARRQNT